ncbi:MAG: hypothetical protein V7782_04495 [Psychromonas sp.]
MTIQPILLNQVEITELSREVGRSSLMGKAIAKNVEALEHL